MLTGVNLKSDNTYYKNLWGSAVILLGAFFLVEHIWSWGYLSLFDFIGHEYLGVLLIIGGILLNLKWKK